MQSLNWFGILLIIMWILNTAGSIFLIGEPRKPISPGSAFMNCIITGTDHEAHDGH